MWHNGHARQTDAAKPLKVVPQSGTSPPLSDHELLRRGVPPRKDIPTKRSKNPGRPRFTPDDIVRAIDGVEAAGLLVYYVEITPTGSIKIITGPRSDGPADQTSDVGLQAEAKTTKKQA